MATYSKKVQVAWEIIEQFIVEWQANPYHWINEFSIQAEIYHRIKTVYAYFGWSIVKAKYKHWILEGLEEQQNWSRVSCEQLMYYNNGKDRCHPDIVIWDDYDDPENPDDEKDGVNPPSLLICEIKYGYKEKEHLENSDIEKLKRLMKNYKKAKIGCWLNFNLEYANKRQSSKWETIEKNLFKNNIYVPNLIKK